MGTTLGEGEPTGSGQHLLLIGEVWFQCPAGGWRWKAAVGDSQAGVCAGAGGAFTAPMWPPMELPRAWETSGAPGGCRGETVQGSPSRCFLQPEGDDTNVGKGSPEVSAPCGWVGAALYGPTAEPSHSCSVPWC